MVLPIIFGIIGGSYGVYQYLNRPRCPKCEHGMKVADCVCNCNKCGYTKRLD